MKIQPYSAISKAEILYDVNWAQKSSFKKFRWKSFLNEILSLDVWINW